MVFGFNDWETWKLDGFCTRCAQIVRRMDARPEVGKTLVVSRPKSVLTRLWRSLKGEAGHDGEVLRRGLWFSLRRVEPDIYVLDHFRLLPKEESSNLVFWINGFLHNRFLRGKIRRVARSLGFREHILWVANPLMIEHAGRVGEKLTVFDAIDDWRLHPQKKGVGKNLAESYRRIPERAGVIFTVSEALEREFSRRHNQVHRLPNGVDVDGFAQPQPRPPEFRDLTGPIIVYVGILQDRVDTDLLEKTARALPRASLVMVGPVVTPDHFRRLSVLENVHFLGRKSHEEIPAFLQHADLCILPHVMNAFTASMNPLKLYEYLCADRPVVATRVDGLADFESVVGFADDADEFVRLIGEALDGEDESAHRVRRSFVAASDWSARIDCM